jgi:Tol biopolymer transport system component
MTRGTESGLILGTAAYMSPEQARGKAVDGRADVWAFGCVLYEMLVGRKAFGGETATDVLAAIVSREPDWGLLPQGTPTSVRRLLRRCLAKDPRLRLHHMADARIELAEAPSVTEAGARAGAAPGGQRWTTLLPWALALGLAGALGVVYVRSPSSVPGSTWSHILAPEQTTFAYFAGPVAISHDGSTLAFVATTSDGQDVVWVRPLGALTARSLPETEGASYPFWSGDDGSLGFFAGGKLKTVETQGGPIVTICDAPGPRGGTWNKDGVILFATVWSGIQRVASSGGVPAPITKVDTSRGELSHRWPYFLPDGIHFAYLAANFVTGSKETASIYVGSLDSPETRLLLPARSNAAFAAGHVLFVRDRTLMAQAFDEKRLAVRGQPFPVAAQVQFDELTWRGVFACARSGALVYQGGNTGDNSRLALFDRAGREMRTIGSSGDLNNHRLSPDGKRVAVGVFESSVANYNLWTYDLNRGKEVRLTFGPNRNSFPVWAPDGSRIVFTSNRTGPWDIFERRSDGTGSEEALLRSEANKYPSDWSADGRFIVFSSTSREGPSRTEEWILPRFGDGKPYPILRGDFSAGEGRFSPDGRWLAYSSDESGRAEVYVTSFPVGSSKWQVSVAGGSSPKWRHDGRELYYLAADSVLMAAEVDPRGSAFQRGALRSLFRVRLKTGASRLDLNPTTGQIGYDTAPDGSWFLVNSPPPGNPPPLTLVTNWAEELRKR